MSYCVNCGVELTSAAKSCPLCDTPVINPNKPVADGVGGQIPERVERVMSRAERRFGFLLASIVLLIPALVTMLCNYFANRALTWSMYVTGGCMLVFVVVLLPYLHTRTRPYLFLLYDFVAAGIFVANVAYLSGNFGWFVPLGLPLVISVFLYAFCVLFIFRKKSIAGFQKLALLSLFTGALVVAVECSIKDFIGAAQRVHWSLFALLPCVVLAVFFLILNKQQRLKEEVKKRLFF